MILSRISKGKLSEKPKTIPTKSNYLNFDWLKSVYHIYKARIPLGYLRLLIVLGISISLIVPYKMANEDLMSFAKYSVLTFISFWLIVRSIIWVYDGFQDT